MFLVATAEVQPPNIDALSAPRIGMSFERLASKVLDAMCSDRG